MQTNFMNKVPEYKKKLPDKEVKSHWKGSDKTDCLNLKANNNRNKYFFLLLENSNAI